MAAEMAQQRARLQAVERDQQGTQQAATAAAPHAKPVQGTLECPPAAAAPAVSPAPASAEGKAPSVEDILCRLSILEGRVGAQLQCIESACPVGATSGPHSAPVSPLKGRDARAEAATALAAAAIYGSSTTQSECCDTSQLKLPAGCPAWAWEAAVPGSPRIAATGLARPASAAGGYYSGGSGVGMTCMLRHSPGGSGAKQRGREVELQVAETSALISGIQGQSERGAGP